MARKVTHLGNATRTPVDHATVPTGILTVTNGVWGFSPPGLIVVATAPTHNPSLVPGRPTAVFCSGDLKIYVWSSGTTWKATAALTDPADDPPPEDP